MEEEIVSRNKGTCLREDDRRLKLTKEERKEILRLHVEEGWTRIRIAAYFHVCSKTVGYIINPELCANRLAYKRFRRAVERGKGRVVDMDAMREKQMAYKRNVAGL